MQFVFASSNQPGGDKFISRHRLRREQLAMQEFQHVGNRIRMRDPEMSRLSRKIKSRNHLYPNAGVGDLMNETSSVILSATLEGVDGGW